MGEGRKSRRHPRRVMLGCKLRCGDVVQYGKINNPTQRCCQSCGGGKRRLHSITWSALIPSDCEMLSPGPFAV